MPGGLPVWWHVGRPNFGDDINPSFFEKIHGRPVRFAADRSRPHVLGAGSILEHATPSSIVCGSGFLEPPHAPVTPSQIVAVRGALTATACGADSSVLLGDPLVLIDAFVERTTPQHRFGFVPHIKSVARWRGFDTRGHRVIDPAWSPWRVVKDIASCELIFSQSLHGLIVADALGVPNVWVSPTDEMRGGSFKFDDYFSTLDRAKLAVPESADLFAAPEAYTAGLGKYRFCKQRYREALAIACGRVSKNAAPR